MFLFTLRRDGTNTKLFACRANTVKQANACYNKHKGMMPIGVHWFYTN